MASDLLTSDTSSTTLGPGSTQCLLSLARVALSASVEIPEFWGGPQLTSQLLHCLLRCPQYEVRELALEGVLRRLQEEEEEEEKKRPQWLDETTLSNLTSLALHETHPQCLAKVRPHTYAQRQYRRCICLLCVCGEPVYVSGCFMDVRVCVCMCV